MSIRKRTWTTAREARKAQEEGREPRRDGTAWVLDYRHEGKRHLETFRTRAEARAREIEIEGEKKDGNHKPRSLSPTVREAGVDWIDTVETIRARRPSTVRQCRYHLDRYIAPALGSRKLADLKEEDVRAFVRDLLRGGMSRPLAKKVLTSLKALLRHAKRENIAADVKLEGTSPSEVDVPAVADIRALLAKLDELAEKDKLPDASGRDRISAKGWRRRRAFIATAIHTGMRASELRGLPWDAVDLDKGTVTVRQMADEAGAIFAPKSRAGVRTIALPPPLVRLLREWKLECPPGGLVFPTRKGNPWPYSAIWETAWLPLLEAAGMAPPVLNTDGTPVLAEKGKRKGKPLLAPRFNFHSLRHFHASRLIASGANPKEVQTEIGHASIKITYDTYGHLFCDEDADRRRTERAERLAADLMAT